MRLTLPARSAAQLLRAQVRLSDPAQYQEIVDAEWNIIYAKLQACADSGARIVLSRLAIGDLATQFFADRDIFCAGRARARPCARVMPSLARGGRNSSPAASMCCRGVCAAAASVENTADTSA